MSTPRRRTKKIEPLAPERAAKSGGVRLRAHREDGEATRARVFSAALGLFRKKGFDAATMRDIAKAAGMSLGAAYHYFPGKHAIVTELFHEHVERHAVLASGAMARAPDFRARLEAALATGIEVRAPDRQALAAISRVVLDPSDPASLFAPETRGLRERSISVFREAVAVDDVPEDARDLAARALWAVHLGLLLVFVRDTSRGSEKTLAIVRRVADLLPTAIGLASTPMFAPVRAQIESLLTEVVAAMR